MSSFFCDFLCVFAQSLGDLYNNYNAVSFCSQSPQFREDCERLNVAFETNYFSLNSPGIGRYVLAMALQGIIFFALVLLLESDFATWLRDEVSQSIPSDEAWRHEAEDVDVAAERRRLADIGNGRAQSAKSDHEVIVIKNLCKTYNSVSCGSVCSSFFLLVKMVTYLSCARQ